MEFTVLCRMEKKQKKNCTENRVTRCKKGFLVMIQFSWEAQDVSQAARTMLFEAWLRHDSHETAQAGCHKTLKHREKVHLSVICHVHGHIKMCTNHVHHFRNSKLQETLGTATVPVLIPSFASFFASVEFLRKDQNAHAHVLVDAE